MQTIFFTFVAIQEVNTGTQDTQVRTEHMLTCVSLCSWSGVMVLRSGCASLQCGTRAPWAGGHTSLVRGPSPGTPGGETVSTELGREESGSERSEDIAQTTPQDTVVGN